MADSADRLDSWKQIAAYLGRSERTVRRWQQTEGMPVHRHLHQQRGSVWAYRKELDEWAAGRRLAPEPAPDPVTPEPAANSAGKWPIAFSSGLALGALAIGLLLWPGRPPLAATPLKAVPLTSLPGIEYGPAFSPDGRKIAFFWGQYDGPRGIHVKTVGSDAHTPLVTSDDRTFLYSPAWSPDGNTIAFLRRTTQGETWLDLIPAAGGLPRHLAHLQDRGLLLANNMHLSWTADGQWILAPAAPPGNGQGIHRISVATGEMRRVTVPVPSTDIAPVLASDGRALAFVRQQSSSRDPFSRVMVMRVGEDGAAQESPQEVLQGRFLTGGLAWAPNRSDLILCSSEHSAAEMTLWRLAAHPGGSMQPLGINNCTTVAVSRVDSGGDAMLALGSAGGTPSALWRANLNALDRATPFAASSKVDLEPFFSPDGSAVAFLSNRSGLSEIWIAAQDGTGPRRVTEGADVSTVPSWSPDGRSLAYSRDGRLFVVPVAGGEPRRLLTPGVPATRPSWSRDGQHLYYSSNWRIWRMRTDDGSAHVVTKVLGQQYVLESPDRQSLFYLRSGRPYALYRLEFASAREEMLHDDVQSPAIAVSNHYVYFMRTDMALYRRSVSGGPVEKLGLLRESPAAAPQRIMFGLAVAPDDSAVVYSVPGRQEIDLMLVRNFR